MKKQRILSLILIFVLIIQTVGCATTNVKKEQADASQIIENIKKSQKSQTVKTDRTTATDETDQSETKDKKAEQPQSDPIKTEEVTLSADNTSAEICDIKIDVGDFVLDGEEELIVSQLPEETTETEDQLIDAYNITLGEKSELDDFITIRIPYRTDFCDAGEDPAECVQGQYKNEETGEWETTLYSVDAESQEVIIMTDHLSIFGVCHVKNSNAKDVSAFSDDISIFFDSATESQESLDSEIPISLVTTFLESDNKALTLQEAGAKILDDLLKKAEFYDEYVFGYADNFTKMLTLGEKGFGNLYGNEVAEALEAIGYAAIAIKAMDIAIRGGTDKDKLDLLYSLATSLISSAASRFTAAGTSYFNMGMVAVYIWKKGVDYAFTGSHKQKMEKLAKVYEFYNDHCVYPPTEHKARSLKDWRMEFVKIIEENHDTPEIIDSLIEKNIDDYCAKFWDLRPEHATSVSGLEYERRKGIEGGKEIAIPENWQRERDKITSDYKHNLLIRLEQVFDSIGPYFKAKALRAYQEVLNKVQDYLNTPIDVWAIEQKKDDEEYKYVDYQCGFGPLSENARPEAWIKGKIDENGMYRTSFTILGYLLSGSPSEFYLYEPKANPFTDEPDVTAPILKLNERTLTVKFGEGEIPFTGTYTGESAKINSVKVSDRLFNTVTQLEWTTRSGWEAWLVDMLNENMKIEGQINVYDKHPNTPDDNEYSLYFKASGNKGKEDLYDNDAVRDSDKLRISGHTVNGTLDIIEEEDQIRLSGTNLEFVFTGDSLYKLIGERAVPGNYDAYYLYFDIDVAKPIEQE